MATKVIPMVGYYEVVIDGKRHFVTKDRVCTCKNDGCVAVQAVVDHLKAGGARADEVEWCKTKGVPRTCPICGAPTRYEPKNALPSDHSEAWTCTKFGNEHLWQARANYLKEHQKWLTVDAMYGMVEK